MKKAFIGVLAAWVSIAAQEAPRFQIDPFWPKPLPQGWVIGRTGSVCSDAHDHLIVTNRRDITDEEAEKVTTVKEAIALIESKTP